MERKSNMYREALKVVIKDLEATNDLLELNEYLNQKCERNDFLNIINELLNELSEEKCLVKDMSRKINSLKDEISRKNRIINKIKNISNENIEII